MTILDALGSLGVAALLTLFPVCAVVLAIALSLLIAGHLLGNE